MRHLTAYLAAETGQGRVVVEGSRAAVVDSRAAVVGSQAAVGLGSRAAVGLGKMFWGRHCLKH